MIYLLILKVKSSLSRTDGSERERSPKNHGGSNLALDIKNDDKIWHLAGAVEHNFGLAGQEFER